MKNMNNIPGNAASAWANDVLASVDGIQRAQANPFLYTRVMARLQADNNGWERAAGLLSRPAFALSAVVVFIAINAGVLFWSQNEEETSLAQKQTVEQALASEFSYTQTYALVEVNDDNNDGQNK